MIDTKLKEWATERQKQYIDAVNEHGGIRPAARALGIDHKNVRRGIHSVKDNAEKHGYSPEHDMVHSVPDSYIVRGTSTLYDAEGKPKIQWVKTKLDENRAQEVVREAISVLVEEIRGLGPITPKPEVAVNDLLAVYPLGDPHINLRTFADESGADFDLNIAKYLMTTSIDRLVDAAPPASQALLLPLGDLFHTNDSSNQTPQSKHGLSVDGNYVQMVKSAIEIYRHIILRMLEKHEHVLVRFVSGNHDPNSIWALALTIDAYFSSEPRVTVDLSPALHWFYRFDKVFIGATHGDKSKMEQLPGIMAAEKPLDWGMSKHRYWYTGHVHRQTVKEYPGAVCESFRTIAPNDTYSAGHGYKSGRDVVCIVHHREHGEIERHRIDVGMI